MKTADVFVNIPVKSIARAYTYRVPQELAKIEAGWRVFVPFGSRKVEGFVVETHELAEAPEKIKLKDIIAAVDEECWFSPQMIEIARWLSEFYLCSLAEIMRLFMPGTNSMRAPVNTKRDEIMIWAIMPKKLVSAFSFFSFFAAILSLLTQPDVL